MITYQEAKVYRDLGYSVFPVVISWNEKEKKFEKKPAIEWKIYQERLPTDEEIHLWFDKPQYNGIGIATGKISGIVVLDVEKDAIEEVETKFPEILKAGIIVKTISGGKHYYFRWEEYTPNTVRIGGYSMDLRGDGGFVVAPPSSFKEVNYGWLN